MKTAVLAASVFVALVACSNGRTNSAGSPAPYGAATSGATAAATPDCHGQSAVWVSERRKTYVLPGNPRYGKGESGSYMCLSDAQSQGYHQRRGGGHHRHHHHHHDALTP